MFKYMENKINIIVISTLFFCILVTVGISYRTVRNSVMDNFIKLSLQFCTLQNENVLLYLKLLEETSGLASKNPNIIHALSDSSFDRSVIPVLDGIRATNISIIGLSIYGENGINYPSSYISNLPSLNQLKEDTFFRQFVNSKNQLIWQVRRREILDFYTSTYYNNTRGILTLLSKIHDPSGRLLGYLLLDTDISSFYQFYSTDQNNFFQGAGSYLSVANGDLLAAPYSNTLYNTLRDDIQQNTSLEKRYIISSDGKYIIIFNRIIESNAISIVTIPLKNIRLSMAAYISLLVVLCILLMIFSVLISGTLTRSIAIPLKKLYDRMQYPI